MSTNASSVENEQLEFKKRNLPNKPGCYIFKDRNGKILYIGKAKYLKKRVNSYWAKKTSVDIYYREKIEKLIKKITDIDVYVVENESEALLLENELIKKYQPKFNARLKDDKSFPWVQFTKEKFPRVKIMRKPEDHGMNHDYLGPFVDSGKLKNMLRFIRKIFPFCTCNSKYKRDHRTRPCTYYQIKLCPAPCLGKITLEEYNSNIEKVKQLLLGNIDEIEEYLEKKMIDASENLNFEEAAIWRDRIEALQSFTIHQSIMLYETKNKNQNNESEVEQEEIDWNIIDVASGYSSKSRAGLIILHVRNGRLLGKTPYVIDIRKKISSTEDYFVDLFQQHYLRDDILIPDEIIVKDTFPSEIMISLKDYLTDKLKVKKENTKDGKYKEVLFRFPNENDKSAGLMRIADKNIELLVKQRDEYEQYTKDLDVDKTKINEGLSKFKELLNLEAIPLIWEAFDMSHMQGTDYVGSKVAFLEGVPNKSEYRRYKIREDLQGSDDVAAMKEVMTRRYRKLIKENQTKPDLIIVDGGTPQIQMADQLLNELGLGNIPHIGIAKPEGRSEKNKSPKIIHIDGESKKEIILPIDSPALHLLQHIRDESHRFAIKYHRKLREKHVSSELDEIEGIGPARRKKLLSFFGSIENIKNAPVEEISEVVGEKLAENVFLYFQKQDLKRKSKSEEKNREKNKKLTLKKRS